MSAIIYVRAEDRTDDGMIHCVEKRFSEEEFLSYYCGDIVLDRAIKRNLEELKRLMASHNTKIADKLKSNQARKSIIGSHTYNDVISARKEVVANSKNKA